MYVRLWRSDQNVIGIFSFGSIIIIVLFFHVRDLINTTDIINKRDKKVFMYINQLSSANTRY